MKNQPTPARKKTARKRTAGERCSVSSGSAPLTFEQGYIAAVANLLRAHDQPTMAADLIHGMNVDWSKIDPYDRDEIKRHGLLPNTH
ncbi:MAG: hypothetical protein Q8M02_03315 [Candidatus Didemnitutus sp.]|nr:hypothetical protein [Candidatus Didemnitutus sp.]